MLLHLLSFCGGQTFHLEERKCSSGGMFAQYDSINGAKSHCTEMMDREGKSATISLSSPALDTRPLGLMSGCSENHHSWGISSE